MLNVIEKIA